MCHGRIIQLISISICYLLFAPPSLAARFGRPSLRGLTAQQLADRTELQGWLENNKFDPAWLDFEYLDALDMLDHDEEIKQCAQKRVNPPNINPPSVHTFMTFLPVIFTLKYFLFWDEKKNLVPY